MHACNIHIKRPKFMHVTCTNMHDISCSVHVVCATFRIKSYSFSLCSLWGGGHFVRLLYIPSLIKNFMTV